MVPNTIMGSKSMDEMENSTQKNGHGPLLIAVALLLIAAIAGVNYFGQRGGTVAQSSTAAGSAAESGEAAAQDTRPMLSPPPGETGSVETEASPEKNAEVVEQLPTAEAAEETELAAEGTAGDETRGDLPGVIVAQDENYGKVVFEPHCVDNG